MQRRTGGVAIVPFVAAQFPMIAGQVKPMPYMALKGEVVSTWYYGARVVDPEGHRRPRDWSQERVPLPLRRLQRHADRRP